MDLSACAVGFYYYTKQIPVLAHSVPIVSEIYYIEPIFLLLTLNNKRTHCC